MAIQPAPFLRRLAARVLDLVFSLMLTFVVAVPVALVFLLVTPILGEDTSLGLAVGVSYFLAYVGLEVFLLVRRDGQSLGKGLLGLRVVPSDATGELRVPLIAWQATVRMLIVFLPFVFASLAGGHPGNVPLDALAWTGFLIVLASLVIAAVPGRRRAVHDLAAGTRVVTATTRRIDWAQDVRMIAPGRIDLVKRV